MLRRWCGWPLALIASLLVPSRGAAQDQVHVSWPLIDFLVCGDSTNGVQLLASANMSSKQGESMGINELSFDPALVRQWTARVLHDLDSADRPATTDSFRIIGPLLPDLPQRAAIAVGYDPASLRGERYFLFWGDSTTRHVWRAAIDAQRVRTLLDALDAMAVVSAVHPDSTQAHDTVVPLWRTEVPPEVVRRPRIVFPPEADRVGAEGRVWLEFVIDTLGHPDMATAKVLFSDAPAFSREALHGLTRAFFRPARTGGRAIAVRVRMPFVFLRSHR